MTVEAFAPAKINLTLHVTGQRADGYHLLDSLVGFADIGDRISASPADGLSLQVAGPMAAGVPTDGSNLMMKAAELLAGWHGRWSGGSHEPSEAQLFLGHKEKPNDSHNRIHFWHLAQ